MHASPKISFSRASLLTAVPVGFGGPFWRNVVWAVVVLALVPIVGRSAAPLDIRVVPKARDTRYWNIVKAGAMKAQNDLAEEGIAVRVTWDGPDREDQAEEQARIVGRCVRDRASAIVLAPASGEGLVAGVEQAKAAGLPVVVIDSLIATDAPVSVVCTNNYKAGYLAGKQLAEAIGGKGNVALFRYLRGQGSTTPREAGFLDAMRKFPSVKVVSSNVFSGATAEEIHQRASALLAKDGTELSGVFAPNLYTSEGMLAALRESGRAGKIAFVAFDSSEVLVSALRQGEVNAITVQQPFMMGYIGVKTAVAAARHESVDREIDTDVKIVTQQNLDTPDVAKLLGAM